MDIALPVEFNERDLIQACVRKERWAQKLERVNFGTFGLANRAKSQKARNSGRRETKH